MRSLLQDVSYGVRTLRKSPGFFAVAVLTLALGIAATTTIFSAINAVVFQKFPFREPGRLVMLQEISQKDGEWPRVPEFATTQEWMRSTRSFQAIELADAFQETRTIRIGGRARRANLEFVTPGMPQMLGIRPVLGRGFASDAGFEQGILIGYGLWQREFGGDPKVIGKRLAVFGGETSEIVGVMPPGAWVFPWKNKVDIWVIADLSPVGMTPDSRWLSVMARLKPGVSIEQAQAEMDVFGRRLASARPDTNRDWTASAVPLREAWFESAKDISLILLCAVGFVLLIACANVVNLLLARAAGRSREIAIRASLGAGRFRITRQLLVESLLLGAAGGLAGLLLTRWGIALFKRISDFDQEVAIDGRVLAFAAGMSLLSGLVSGLAPAVQASAVDLNAFLKEGGRGAVGGRRSFGRNALVAGELALTVILLNAAALMAGSFLDVVNGPAGFNPHGLLTASITLSAPKYVEGLPKDMQRVNPAADLFHDEALDRLRKMPGVTAAAREGGMRTCPVRILGQSSASAAASRVAVFSEVSPSFFRTLEIPILKGRAFTERDDARAPWVAIVSEGFARRYFPGEDALGKQIQVSFRAVAKTEYPEPYARQIVGVVGRVFEWGKGGTPAIRVYVPQGQHMNDFPGGASGSRLVNQFFIRTAGDALSLTPSARRIFEQIEPGEILDEVATQDQLMQDWLSEWRSPLQLFAFLSGLAIALAVVGVYGVMAYTVSRRTHEIGLRLALGAEPPHILRAILLRGLKLTIAGLAIGAAGAVAAARVLESRFPIPSGMDPLLFSLVALLLAAVSLAACYIPARRATRIDPLTALRYE